MSLINQIKADQVVARKARLTSKASSLTTLLGETLAVGKNANRETTDEEVISVVKKFINNIDICLEVEKDEMKIMDLKLEQAWLKTYLPVQIDSNQMFQIIKRIRASKGIKLELKDIMQAFKTQFPGMYDGKNLSTVAKEYIAVQV